MISAAPLTLQDLQELDVQPVQAADFASERPDIWFAAYSLLARATAWRLEDDGRVAGIAALEPSADHPSEALVWALLADNLGAAMVGITRAVRHWFRASGFARIAMLVRRGHEDGARWAVMLGFYHHGGEYLLPGQDGIFDIYMWENGA